MRGKERRRREGKERGREKVRQAERNRGNKIGGNKRWRWERLKKWRERLKGTAETYCTDREKRNRGIGRKDVRVERGMRKRLWIWKGERKEKEEE